MQISKVSKQFNELMVLNDITFQIPMNKTTVILGPSGCGKTTLLRILSGLESHDKGNIDEFTELEKSYMFQDNRLIPWKTVSDNIGFILPEDVDTNNKDILINEVIDNVDLTIFKDFYPNKLSGGMKQRVAMARAFVYPSEFLLMDEPFRSLDPDIKEKLISYFIKLNERYNHTVIMVTHDLKIASEVGDQIIILSKRPAKVIKTIHNELDYYTRKKDKKKLLELESELLTYLV